MSTSILSDFDRLHAELAEAVVACRAHTGKRAVQSLRTGTRKLEAVLQKVIEDHPAASRLRKTAKKALRELKRIRKTAGPVRDLDVHRQLAEELLGQMLPPAAPLSKQSIAEEHRELDRRLRRRRRWASARLERVLKKTELRLEAALEDTSKAMAHLRVASPSALATAREWARNSAMPFDGSFEENLHGYRKQTKAARYLAGLEESAAARALVKRLKAMQDSIGRWHDLMLLAGEAADILGERSVLTRAVRVERDRALDTAARSVEIRREGARTAIHTQSPGANAAVLPLPQ